MANLNFKVLAVTGAVASLFLAGCGGGGSDPVDPVVTPKLLSGTAAGGAAIIGSVIVTDSKGATKSGLIEAGHYSIDVGDMTGPFVLKAAGTVGDTSVTYYSAATAADVGGTVNVTPFTNLIVSNIAAQMAETYFSNPDNIAKIGTLMTPANLLAAETALQAKLQPVLTAMGVSDSIDLLRSTFAPDHSGMDAVLDLVKVEVDTTTNIATLKNALTQAVMATDNAADNNDTTPVSNITGITPTAATDLQAVVAKLNGFAALFATGLPTRAAMEASGVFDISSNFIMGGQTFAQFADELSTQSKAVGLKFSNVAIELDASGNSGMLTTLISSNSADFGEKIQLKMVKLDGVWKVQGDGMIANISLNAQATFNQWSVLPSSTQSGAQGQSMQSGINIWIDPFAYNSTSGRAPVVSALITGPGLGNGITMVQDTQNTWLKLSNSQYSDNLVPDCAGVVTVQCVTVAQAVDNSQYTVVLKDGSGNALNGTGYKLTLAKQPYATSALTTAMFPTITSITIDGSPLTPSTVIANKSVAIAWTMPAGLQARDMNIWANTTTDASYVRVEKSLASTDTSALIGLGDPINAGTVNNAGVWLEGMDSFGRRFAISKSVQSQ